MKCLKILGIKLLILGLDYPKSSLAQWIDYFITYSNVLAYANVSQSKASLHFISIPLVRVLKDINSKAKKNSIYGRLSCSVK